MPALDYSQLAEDYDDFCVFVEDVEFFRSLVADRGGRVLELMAGTGRLSVPLVEAGSELTCLDSSHAMLRVLRRKLDERDFQTALACADVCAIPLQARFDTVILPFNGFCELVTGAEQRRAMRAVAGVLAAGGRFVCTTHNPRIRRRALDGSWQDLGEFPRPSGGVVRLAMRGTVDPATGIAAGEQRIEVAEESARPRVTLTPLRFSLVSASDLVALAGAAGLKLVALCGDYDGSAYDETRSPSVIATFERAA